MFSKILAFLLFLIFLPILLFSQLSYNREIVDRPNVSVISNIAYKLPFRGENYKFYGTLRFHISGHAFVNNKVYNTFIEARHLSLCNMPEIHMRLLKSSGKKEGRLYPRKSSLCGNYIIFMTPLMRNGKPVNFYYRTGLFRYFNQFDKNGKIKRESQVCIDFETLSQYLINLDNAAHFFGLKVNTVTVKREYIKKLYNTSLGTELKNRDLRFVKYLSRKTNRKYEELFLVEFGFERK